MGRTDPTGYSKTRRHDGDDLIGPTLERDRSADDLGIATKAPAPEAIAQNDDAMTPVDLVLAGECATERRRDSEHVEKRRGDALGAEVLGLRPRFPQREGAPRNGRNGFEHLLLGDPVGVVLWRDAAHGQRVAVGIGIRPRRPPFADGHEPIVLVEGQPSKHDRVHDREDRRARADAQRQDDQGDRGEGLGGSE